MYSFAKLLSPVILGATLIAGCETIAEKDEAFRFPILEGSIDEGRESFVDLQCHQCHGVSGVDLPEFEGESPLHLVLGGELHYVKTYGALLTAIINPNHVVSKRYLDELPQGERRNADSPMPYKDHMTVRELVNLVTFLNSRYVLVDGYREGEEG